jgi:hypothetical protein
LSISVTDNRGDIRIVGEVSDNPVVVENQGLSLRDYFAAAALTGLTVNSNDRTYETDAMMAYKYADAMLAERLRKP